MKYGTLSLKRKLGNLKAKKGKTRNDKQKIRYFSNVLRATPKWLSVSDEKAMKQIYRKAHKQGRVVDHVVPLASPLVCGLHVPWNLQAVSQEENQKKGNKWWPNCPFEQASLFASDDAGSAACMDAPCGVEAY